IWFGEAILPLWLQASVWGVLLLAQTARWPQAWARLFGAIKRPFGAVWRYDLICSARKGRFALVRCLYAAALLLIFLAVYWNQFGGGSGDFSRLWSGTANIRDVTTRVSDFTQAFVYRLFALQLVAAVLLTPVCTAGAITEEKDRRTLEYLLASDFANDEIVLGKLASRVANLSLLLLMGLPFLGSLQLLNGIDPSLVLTAFIVTLMTMLSLAGLSILVSVYVGKPLTAVMLTYAVAAAYLLVSGLIGWVFQGADDVLFLALTSGNAVQIFDHVVQWQELLKPLPLGQRSLCVPFFIGEYAAFHAFLAVACPVWAVVRLRARSRTEAGRRAPRPFTLALRPRRKPAIGDQPMRWKELYAEPIL